MTNNSARTFNPQEAPFSEEAEEAVIGAVLINPDSYLSVASFLKDDDFYFLRHQYIWQALNRLSERDEPVDYLTLSQELRDMDWLETIGGLPYLTRLINNTPTSIHAEFYARIVERTAIRRRLLVAADEIKALAHNEQLDIENVITQAEQRMFNVTDRQLKREFVPLRDAVSDYFDQIEHLMQNPQITMGTPSGFRDLDEILGGFQRSDLLIFAGRPGMGKTSFMLSTAVNAARLGARVAIFTMEMGADQLVQRMISMETGINSHQLRLGRLSQQEYSRFVEAAGRISRFQIFIDDTPALNPLQMRTKCRRLQHEYGLDLVMVDYLQLMNSGGTYENNRVQEISFISRAMKELARELNVPIFSAAQLSRAVEQRQDKRPLLSDLRESGAIEQDSDIVMFLYRDVVYNETTEFPNQAEVIVAKHRNGATGTISLYFDNTLTKFMDGAVRRVDLGDI
ncbi:MAG TPA: replicative DNA helicase [Phototrophicaceae bacterium]|jgi:replicative DNA helicase|nr:replicative DNA helicase [Phototrophicaceae bacterium]